MLIPLMVSSFTACLTPCIIVLAGAPVQKQAAAGGFFSSAPVLIAYGLVAGLGLAWAWIWYRKKKEAKAGAPDIETPGTIALNYGPVHPVSREDADKEQDELIRLELQLALCQQERAEVKRQLAEAEQFARVDSRQKKTGVLPDQENKEVAEAEPGFTITDYYLQPDSDGLFQEFSRKDTRLQGVYELSYWSNNPTEASLQFIDTTENVFFAKQNEASWIMPACEPSNLPAPDTRSIRTDVPGKVIYRNGAWEVQQKAKITYV